MRKTIAYRLAVLCLGAMLAFPLQSQAGIFKKKKASDTETTAKKEKPSDWDKFVKKAESADGFINIYKKDKDIFLEIPDSLMGREVLLSSVILKSSDPDVPTGKDVSSKPAYLLDRTDSLVLFRTPASIPCISDSDQLTANQLESSNTAAVVHALPIKYRNADSSAVVVNATKIFSAAYDKSINLKGLTAGQMVVTASSVKDELTGESALKSFSRSVGVQREVTMELTMALASFGFESSNKPRVSLEVLTTLTLLPQKSPALLEADSRIGTRNFKKKIFYSGKGIEQKDFVQRWDLAKDSRITFYADTALPASWRKVAAEAVEQWNGVFKTLGYDGPFKVVPFPADSCFNSADPLNSTISIGTGSGINAFVGANPVTGEIFAARITIPLNYIERVRKVSKNYIGDVDPRYSMYNVPESAILEVLKADLTSIFGAVLGIDKNPAAAKAYSPEQITDPEFTAANGFCSSVRSGVVFNYLAGIGDKERGVKLVNDAPGAYDRYALEYAYSISCDRDSLISSHKGDPAYYYCESSSMDPRGAATVLGNDFIAASEALCTHIKNVAANAASQIAEEAGVDEDYKMLYLDWLYLDYCKAAAIPSSLVGGMYCGEMRDSYSEGKYTAVPAELQRTAVKSALKSIQDFDWLRQKRDLITMAGANNDLLAYTNGLALRQSGLLRRIPYVMMAEKNAGSGYTAKEFINEIVDASTVNLRKGKLDEFEDDKISELISTLCSYSPVMAGNLKKVTSPNGIDSESESFTVRTNGVPSELYSEIELLCVDALKTVRQRLYNAKNIAADRNTKGRIEYLLFKADAALEGEK